MSRICSADDTRIHRIAGSGITIRGDDIDTDQILPARYLKAITFAGMEDHAFEDARAAARSQGDAHPLDQARFAGGSLLLVNRNFGYGSSREHAPQSLHRLGIAAVIGKSFGEIFAGNCVAIGMPCVQADADTIAALQQINETAAQTEFLLDLAGQTIAAGRTHVSDHAGGSATQTIPGWNVGPDRRAACCRTTDRADAGRAAGAHLICRTIYG